MKASARTLTTYTQAQRTLTRRYDRSQNTIYSSRSIVTTESISESASAASYATSGGMVIYGFTMSEIIGLVGAVFLVLTFFVNLYFKIERRKHDKLMASLRAQELRMRDVEGS